MLTTLYVYYRVDPSRQASARATLRRLTDALTAAGHPAPRLARRADDPDLWMEIHDAAPAGFEATLARLVDASGLHDCLAPGQRRHVERFVPLPLTDPA